MAVENVKDAIAERRFLVTDAEGAKTRDVTFRIGKPEPDLATSGFACWYQLMGSRIWKPKLAKGRDSMEALEQAIRAVRAELTVMRSIGLRVARAITPESDSGFRPILALEEALGARDRKDYVRSFQLALPLAESGLAIGQALLACHYMLGWGVQADISAAVHWYSLAAEAGDANACDALSAIYFQGMAGAPNPELGRHYRRMADEAGLTARSIPPWP